MNFLQKQRLRRITKAAYSSGEWAGEHEQHGAQTGRIRWTLDPLTALVVGLGILALTLLLVWGANATTYEETGASSGGDASYSTGQDSEEEPPGWKRGHTQQSTPGRKLEPRGFAETAEGATPPGASAHSRDGEQSGAAEEKIIVHVAGSVKHPGIVTLAKNSRVFQAIEQAGGVLPEASPQSLNLAAHLHDGDFLYVPTREEASSPPSSPQVPSGIANNATTAGDTPRQQPSECVNINTGDAQELQRLPGVGPALSQRILDYRKENGNFTQIEDLDAVSGIGMGMINRIRSHVCS